MAKLVLVPGTNEYVNPEYVTNVYPEDGYLPGQYTVKTPGTSLYVVGDAGYQTKRIWTASPVAVVVSAVTK